MKTMIAALTLGLALAASADQPKPEKEFSIEQTGTNVAEITIKVNAATKWKLLTATNVAGPFNEVVTNGVGGKAKIVVVPTDEPKRFYLLSLEARQQG